MQFLTILILSIAAFFVFRWFTIETISAIRNKKEKEKKRNAIIAKNILTYIEYFQDMSIDMQREVIESELNDPLLD